MCSRKPPCSSSISLPVLTSPAAPPLQCRPSVNSHTRTHFLKQSVCCSPLNTHCTDRERSSPTSRLTPGAFQKVCVENSSLVCVQHMYVSSVILTILTDMYVWEGYRTVRCSFSSVLQQANCSGWWLKSLVRCFQFPAIMAVLHKTPVTPVSFFMS